MILLGIGAASAQTITQSHSTAATSLDFSDNFAITPFDTSLGTLTGVQVELSVDVTASLLVANANSSSRNFTNASASVPITITGPAASANLDLMETATASVASGTVAPLTTNSYPGMTLSDSGSYLVSSSDFSFWETAPLNLTLNFNAGTNGTYTGQSGLNVLFGGTATGDATTTVVYSYTPFTTSSPTPEPTTAVLMAFALGALCLARRLVTRRS